MAGAGAQALRRLIRALDAADGQELDEAILQASQVLEQDKRFRGYDEVLRRPSWRRSMPADYTESYPQRIRADAAHYLPRSLVGRRLEPGEQADVTAALTRLLDRGVRVASALFALGKGTDQAVIPRIADEVRRQIGRDAWAIYQAAYALEDLLYVPPGRRRLSRAQAAVFQDACEALGAAVTVDLPYPPSSPERGYVPDPREAVTQVLGVLCDRFQPRRRRPSLGRRRRGDRLQLRVEQVQVLPSGDLALDGPMHLDVNQPQLQARTVVRAPDRPPREAAHIGLHFDVGAWPTRRRPLLRGLAAADVPVGTLVRADDAEERELIIGMNRGDLRPLDRFGSVVREGLPPSEFLLLYKAAAEVRIPEPTPDLERRARWERIQERLAEIRRRA